MSIINAQYDVTTSLSDIITTRTDGSNATQESVLLPFDDGIVIFVATILITLLVFGFIGNLITMLVILTSQKLQNVFNQFILSLCISDLISASISWINLYRRTWGFNVFELPNFFCVFYWGAEMWTSYVTAQHIISFAVLRLISVWKPVFFSKIKSSHAKIWIVVVWIAAFLCGFIPFAVFSGARKRDRSDTSDPVSKWPACTQNSEWLEQYALYTKFAYSIFFYIPLVAVVAVSLAIGLVMIRRKPPQNNNGEKDAKTEKRKKKERQAIIQLALIVGSFMLGYVPFTVYEFYTIGSEKHSHEEWRFEWMFGMVQYICLRFSECLNPLFYNLASSKMRKETWKFLSHCRCKCDVTITRSISTSNSSPTGLDI